MRWSTCGRILFSLCTASLLLVLLCLVVGAQSPKVPATTWRLPAWALPGPRAQEDQELFVKPDGSGTACTQAQPCTLATALSRASDGDCVYLAAGTYRGSGAAVVTLDHSIMLWGGWDGQPTGQPYFDTYFYGTILDGENQRRVVYVNPGLTVTVGGMAIMYGSATDLGAGLYARDANVTIVMANLVANTVNSLGAAGTWGGGAYIEGGELEMAFDYVMFNSASCTTCWQTQGGGIAVVNPVSVALESVYFWRNTAWFGSGLYVEAPSGAPVAAAIWGAQFVENGWDSSSGLATGRTGGAVYLSEIDAVIRDSQFLSNTTVNGGGAIHADRGSLHLESCYLADNQSMWGAAVDVVYGVADLINNIIVHNVPRPWGGAVDWYQSKGTLVHNTLAGNRGPEGGIGILLDVGCNASLVNNILVGHTVGISVTGGSKATLDATLWGAGAWANSRDYAGSGQITTGTRNLWADPHFLSPAAENYHLAAGSPAVDAGLDSGVATDIDGEPRPMGDGYDIGADERGPYGCILPVVRRR